MPDTGQMSVGMLTGAEVMTTAPDTTLVEVAKVISGAGVGALVVGSAEDLQGVVSERDVVRAVAEGRELTTTTAADVASTDLVWADASASIDEVALEMSDKWVRHVLVEDGGSLVGIVSARDLLGAYAAVGDSLD
jgi:CBS domain-containing protein